MEKLPRDQIIQQAFNAAMKVVLDNTDSVKEANELRLAVSTKMDDREPVPVGEKLAEAFKAIRHNFAAQERMEALIKALREGSNQPEIWEPLFEELGRVLGILRQTNIPPIEPKGRPFYKEDLESMTCARGCGDPGVFIHSKCHMGHPIWVEYSPGGFAEKGDSFNREQRHVPGLLILRCSECDNPVAQIAVASQK